MQLKVWLDDNNTVTFALKLSSPGHGQPDIGPEIIAASVVDSKLSDIQENQLIDLMGQTADYFSVDHRSPGPAPDWREEFLAATRNNSG